MSFKKESSPLAVGQSKRSSSNSSLPKSFKSLQADEDEEEDLTVLTGKFEKDLEKRKSESIPARLTSLGPATSPDSKSLGSSPRSRSFEEEKSSLNVSKLKQNFAEISAGWKEKIAKKWEEISQDLASLDSEESRPRSASSSPVDITDRKLASVVEEAVKKSKTGEKSADSKQENMNKTPEKENNSKDKDTKNSLSSSKVHSMTDLEIERDTEPLEDFLGNSSLLNSGQEVRQRKHSKSKSEGESPITFSSLLGRKSVDEEDSSSYQNENKEDTKTNEESVFYDPNPDKLDEHGTPVKKTTSLHIIKEKVINRRNRIGLCILCMAVFPLLPLPSFLSGFLMGAFLMTLIWIIYTWITTPVKVKPFRKVPYEELPPLVTPEMKEAKSEDGKFKGWMNEITTYIPENYHKSQTFSVYVELENASLRLRRPKKNIPKHASSEDETSPQSFTFVHQRHYNMEGSSVFLLPAGLVKKRFWSKKYPICITIATRVSQSGSVPSSDRSRSPSPKAHTPDSEDGFEMVSNGKGNTEVLYLFARTCREKEDWYKRFAAASRGSPLPSHLNQVRTCLQMSKPSFIAKQYNNTEEEKPKHCRHDSSDSTSSTSSSPQKDVEDFRMTQPTLEMYIRYMGRLMPKKVYEVYCKSKTGEKQVEKYPEPVECDAQLMWVNAFISRLFWDFLKEKYFIDIVLGKIQKKLSKIHIPYFIETLTLTHLELGNTIPAIRRGSYPYFDDQGFWVDMDINYDGGFRMTIETKVNLMKLKEEVPESTKEDESEEKKLSATTNSDEEDSAESSSDSDDDASSIASEDSSSGKSGGKKLMYYLNMITKSKYFKSATEIKYVKKKMEEVSNTPLELTVEVRGLSGTLALNIPPPPTDRLWYGFRGKPNLQLVAKPKVGTKAVTITHITEWIQKKLVSEFQKVVVFPNMDDIVLPMMARFQPRVPEELSEKTKGDVDDKK